MRHPGLSVTFLNEAFRRRGGPAILILATIIVDEALSPDKN
jgi:hypothetical protein